MLVIRNGGDEYENQKVSLRENMDNVVLRLVDVLKRLGIKHLYLTGLGTSLTSAFSSTDLIKPLLNRDENLVKILEANGISVHIYNFSAPQKNREREIHKWITKDIHMSELNRRIVSSLDALGIKVDTKEDYPLEIENDPTFKEAHKDRGSDSLNVVVYNGFTGSFLDVPSRSGGPDLKSMAIGFLKRGLLKLRFLKTFKEDRIGAQANFQAIQDQNPNTQVYVGGIPLISKFGPVINLFLNRKIRNVCNKFSNVVYTNPAPINGIYRCRGLYNQTEGKIVFDFHPNDVEYRQRLYNFIDSIANNCIKTAFCNELTQALSNLSSHAEYPHTDEEKKLRWNSDYVVNTVLLPIIKKYDQIFANQEEREAAYSKFKVIFDRDFPHESWFISENTVLDTLPASKSKKLDKHMK